MTLWKNCNKWTLKSRTEKCRRTSIFLFFLHRISSKQKIGEPFCSYKKGDIYYEKH